MQLCYELLITSFYFQLHQIITSKIFGLYDKTVTIKYY